MVQFSKRQLPTMLAACCNANISACAVGSFLLDTRLCALDRTVPLDETTVAPICHTE
jgi:hypothetical protein